MSDPQRLMEIMSERLERHLDPFNETAWSMRKVPKLAFAQGYMQAVDELSRAIYFNEKYESEPGEYEVGYWYACLVILGLDTTGIDWE